MCLMPIGYNRCCAVEKLLESIKISCPNAKYGCKDMFSCNLKTSHEKECVNTRQKEIVLLDQNDSRLFIVHNNLVDLGNMVHVSCLGPKSVRDIHYDVLARSQGSTLILQSSMKTIQHNNGCAPTTNFLLIPSYHFGFGQLKLNIRIKSQLNHT